MTNLNTTNVQSRMVTAFFDKRDAADRAAEALASLGVPRERVQITEGAEGGAAGAKVQPADKGFWEELKGLFLPDEDRYGYAEGLRRGGYLLSAQVEDAHYEQAIEVLDSEGAVNMDEREAGWRQSGWTGYQTEATTQTAGTVGATAAALSPAPASVRQDQSTVVGQNETIPVYEETAKIGKRDVGHGRVRLRTYVVETPFTEQVDLREERVQVERRPVDRPVAAGDAVFQDRVIEAEEHAEEAIISKETRIKEEIGLRKSVENRSQTVSETLRRTEVEVQDERSGSSLKQGFTGTVETGRIAEHMDVIASDGTKIGVVDHLDGDNIKLAKLGSPDGQHHYIPLAWIDHVDTHVHLSKPAMEAKASW